MSGPGMARSFASLRVACADVTACDPSVNAVARLNSLFRDAPNVEFAVGSADALPYGDAEFDVVVINSVLQCLPSTAVVEKSLAEIVRVCSVRRDGLRGRDALPQ